MSFNLRRPHDRRHGFDAFLLAVACIGFLMIWLGVRAGGGWIVLAALAALGEILLAYGIWIEPNRLAVQRYRMNLQRDPKTWIRIVFLSDLHAGAFHPVAKYERIAREAAALNPDVVLLGGDYVVDLADPVKDLAVLKTIPARYGRYFVLGNHDMIDRPQDIRASLSNFGYEDLTNRSVTIDRDGSKLELQGVDDCWYGKNIPVHRSSADVPHVTLSHEPDVLMDMKEGQTDLVLIGHTHGGQIRVPFIGPLWPIPSKLGRQLDKGKKVVHGIPCIVSDGLGETDGRLRIGSPPEIVVVEVGI